MHIGGDRSQNLKQWHPPGGTIVFIFEVFASGKPTFRHPHEEFPIRTFHLENLVGYIWKTLHFMKNFAKPALSSFWDF